MGDVHQWIGSRRRQYYGSVIVLIAVVLYMSVINILSQTLAKLIWMDLYTLNICVVLFYPGDLKSMEIKMTLVSAAVNLARI